MNMLQEVYSFLAALNVDLYRGGYARNPEDVIKEMCEEWGIPFRTYMKRKKWGWNDKFALETPPNGYKK